MFVVYALLRRKKKTPEELERERRAWLDGVGRITDGTVIDVQEIPSEGRSAAIHLIYKYDVAGVSYECSQDVTHLRHWINLHSCRLGLPTSVKYDQQNPGNSLVVSDVPSGHLASGVPARVMRPLDLPWESRGIGRQD